MIVDTLGNFKLLENDAKLLRAFEFIKNMPPNINDGRYDIDDEIFASVSSYTTIPLNDGKFESHKKYIDIQLLIQGSERIGWTNIDKLVPCTEYNLEKDIIFYKQPEEFFNFITLTPGLFMIFYPSDAHMPQIMFKESSDVKKVVIKIEV